MGKARGVCDGAERRGAVEEMMEGKRAQWVE